MARGTTAWVRRGAEAMWQSHGWPAGGTSGAQGRGHMTSGHATTRVHVGARVGRHVAGKDGSRRAHGYSGTLVRYEGR